MAQTLTIRIELAKQGRAGCRNTACKKAEIKIGKGEFRAGTFVELPNGNSGWHWKHWFVLSTASSTRRLTFLRGCFTPLQLEKLNGQIEGLDLDDDKDMEVIDGWEDLPQEQRDLLREALKQGHVGDDVWKGVSSPEDNDSNAKTSQEPELNRPGQKGINRKTPKKKTPTPDVDEQGEVQNGEVNDEPIPMGAMRAKSRKKSGKNDGDDEAEVEAVKPKAKKSKKGAKAATANANEEAAPSKKTKKATKAIKAATAPAESDDEKPELAKKPAKKSKKSTKADADDANEEGVVPAKKPAKGRGKKAQAHVDEVEDEEHQMFSDIPEPKTKQGKKRARADEEADEEVQEAPAKKTRGKAKGRKAKA